ncbi:unnamed protein product [Thelazia callipaeda]|uniref:Protein aurora borealis n=1 Tax=Thelazia callipaeda TaxID=103827 RepID=A0A0N5D5X1_THECL|nr:unnamed protein product [Thelazia callipaeda]
MDWITKSAPFQPYKTKNAEAYCTQPLIPNCQLVPQAAAPSSSDNASPSMIECQPLVEENISMANLLTYSPSSSKDYIIGSPTIQNEESFDITLAELQLPELTARIIPEIECCFANDSSFQNEVKMSEFFSPAEVHPYCNEIQASYNPNSVDEVESSSNIYNNEYIGNYEMSTLSQTNHDDDAFDTTGLSTKLPPFKVLVKSILHK